jgi:antitoxin (DNA-binding transcriptional repressor) of toxin-antitoxin stability system
MKKYNIAEAKSHFSVLVKKALMGAEIVIARDSKPLIKPVPLLEIKKSANPVQAKDK